VLEDNRAELKVLIDPENKAGPLAKRETEEALRTALANMETFRKFEEKMQAIETNVKEYIVAYQKDLSYYPSSTATTSSR
jgi:hypothetical protein